MMHWRHLLCAATASLATWTFLWFEPAAADPQAEPLFLAPFEQGQGEPSGGAAAVPVPLPEVEPSRTDERGEAASPLLPGGYAPWWQERVEKPLWNRAEFRVRTDSLVLGALRHSSKIQVISDLPVIQETSIDEALGAFNVRAFVESRYVKTNEPVGNTLTTGGPSRLKDGNWTSSGGLRKRTYTGAQVELSQRFGFENSNSIFFQPQDQAASRLALSFTQPLLNGAGRAYNESLIVLAQLETGIAGDEYLRQLQAHLIDVTQAYWSLYLERATLLQKRRLHEQADRLAAELQSRKSVDALASQIARAKAAAATRGTEIIRAEAAVRNAESRIRALVNDPDLCLPGAGELIPGEAPCALRIRVQMHDELETALQRRPEVDQAFKQVRAAGVRLAASERELLPFLNLIVESYVAGLDGHYDGGQSFVNQFGQGAPSYTVGLTFEAPLGNQAARARNRKRQAELRQMTNQLQSALDMVRLEVEVAVREVETAQHEVTANLRALEAHEQELNYRQQRWQFLPTEELGSVLLDELLSAQDRVAAAESAFLNSQIAYTLALTNLKRATGTLLEHQPSSAAVQTPGEGAATAPAPQTPEPLPDENQPRVDSPDPVTRLPSDIRSSECVRLPPVRR